MSCPQIPALVIVTLALACGGSSTTSSATEAGATTPEAGAAAKALGDGPRAQLTAPDAGGGAGGGAAGAGGGAAGGGPPPPPPPTGGAGGSAAGDAGALADAPPAVADAPPALADAAPFDPGAAGLGAWLFMSFPQEPQTPRTCRCGADERWSCFSESIAAKLYGSLAKLCGGVGEGAACSGSVEGAQAGDVAFPGFSIRSGTCRAGRCCPGCWDGKRCRVSFTNNPGTVRTDVAPTAQKQWDVVGFAPPGEWHYWCGSGGEVCREGKGDQEGLKACGGRPVASGTTCPDKITH